MVVDVELRGAVLRERDSFPLHLPQDFGRHAGRRPELLLPLAGEVAHGLDAVGGRIRQYNGRRRRLLDLRDDEHE